MAKRLAIIPAIFLIVMCVVAGSLGLSDLYREEASRIINEWFLMYDLEALDLEEMDPDVAESGVVFSGAVELEDVDPELLQSGTVYSGVLDSELIESDETNAEILTSEAEVSEAANPEESDTGVFNESEEAYFDMDEVTAPVWSWEQAHRYLRLALQLSPYDPTALEELARIHQISVERYNEEAPFDTPELDKSQIFYRQSLTLRPAWPYGWMGIMLLKIKENQFDEDFVIAMKRAAELGPWELGIQMGIVEDGLPIRASLPEELRNLVMDTVEKGLQRESKYIIAVAEQYGLIEPRVEVSGKVENVAE